MKLLALLVLVCPTLALAQMDLNLAAAGRSTPSAGGSFLIESGYNYLWWEKDQDTLYGLIRPSVYLDSSAVINTYGGKIGLYPISFAGIEIGKETTVSDYDGFTYYDCSEVACRGTMQKSYLSYKLGLSLGPLVATGNVVVYQSDYDYEDSGEIAEYVFTLLADPEGETIYFSRYIMGLKETFGGFLGVVADFAQMKHTAQTFESTYLIYGYRTEGGSTITYGAGTLKSEHLDSNMESSLVLYARWSWWPLPTKLLF